MTKIRKFSVAAIVLSALAVTTTLLLPATVAAESVDNSVSIVAMEQTPDYGISTNAATLAPPILTTTAYNVAVKYTWHAGSGADALAMYTSYHPDLAPVIYNSTVFEQIAFPATGKKDCVPGYILGASYNTSTKIYSEKTSTEWTEVIGPNQTKVRYGIDAKYDIVGQINHAMITGNVPTEYDQTHFIWDNNAKNFQTIKGTISYHGYVSDIEVSVPWIGYNSTSVNLDGVTFYLRTGPWKCSIKASSAVRAYDVKFGFGIL